MWFDFKKGTLTDVSSRLGPAEDPLLLIPHEDGYHVVQREFTSILLGDTPAILFKDRKLEWSLIEHSVRFIKRKDGRSFLFIGLLNEYFGPDSGPFYVIDLDRRKLREVNLRKDANAKFIDVFENEGAAIEGLFGAQRGFKLIQIYGPLK